MEWRERRHQINREQSVNGSHLWKDLFVLGSGRFLDIRTGYLDLESGSVVRMELDSDFY